MKLFIISSMVFFSNKAHAGLTIHPEDNDPSFTLVNCIPSRVNTILDCKRNITTVKSKNCNYSINDYRYRKDSETGCAVNNNRINSNTYGDICN